MWPVVGAIVSALGGGVKSFFGVKKAQADIVNSAVKVVGDVNASNVARERAAAQIITSETNSGYWLAAIWRPMLMVFFAVLIGCYWFGWVPSNLLAPMPEGSGIFEIFAIVKVGIMGYIPARTIEKIISGINVTKIIERMLGKK